MKGLGAHVTAQQVRAFMSRRTGSCTSVFIFICRIYCNSTSRVHHLLPNHLLNLQSHSSLHRRPPTVWSPPFRGSHCAGLFAILAILDAAERWKIRLLAPTATISSTGDWRPGRRTSTNHRSSVVQRRIHNYTQASKWNRRKITNDHRRTRGSDTRQSWF